MSDEIAWKGRYLEMRQKDGWEFVTRTSGMSAVVIIAEIDDHLLLVEQFRVPVGRNCLELPAGLIGDDDGKEDSVEDAAARELEEETGYRPGRIQRLGEFYSSSGVMGESFHLVRAHDCVKVGEGGGTDSEDITVHKVPLSEVSRFIERKRQENVGMDVRLMCWT
ncbi:NUDIX hydrolase [Sphingomicrobium lutaoense]|uniref:GDP-mannose pyrophosphatase n=1 Tax=Sphingomicrobium lutaoense TaxID=515949 RepID=A0A839Z2Y8_9SPHN|nr:NUDIX hydrolase [Sphingomicrobium lutaoense]MBB3764123.1 ADP-ribose pyrophosphatase [Sphingomicrobium lutaoense]